MLTLRTIAVAIFSGVLLLCNLPVASAADTTWYEIGSKLKNLDPSSASKLSDLDNFIIEAQPCENSGKIPSIIVSYDFNVHSPATNGTEKADWYNLIFPGEIEGGSTNTGFAVNETDGTFTIYKIWPSYCYATGAKPGDPRPAVRIRFKGESLNHAIVYGKPITAPLDDSTPAPKADIDDSTPAPKADIDDSTPAPTVKGSKTAATTSGIKLINPLGTNKDGSQKTLIDILASVFKVLQYLMFAVVPIFVVIGAFQMIFAAGNPEKFATGQKTILYAVIGLVIILVANGLVAIVKSILTV